MNALETAKAALQELQRWESRLSDSPMSMLLHYKRGVAEALALLDAAQPLKVPDGKNADMFRDEEFDYGYAIGWNACRAETLRANA